MVWNSYIRFLIPDVVRISVPFIAFLGGWCLVSQLNLFRAHVGYLHFFRVLYKCLNA